MALEKAIVLGAGSRVSVALGLLNEEDMPWPW